MKYMLLLFDEGAAADLTAEEHQAWAAFRAEAERLATQVSAEPLEAASTATVVSVRDGKRLTTDGPFAETKEQLGGFFIFDCDSLEVALSIAAKAPVALTGHVEVRAVYEVA